MARTIHRMTVAEVDKMLLKEMAETNIEEKGQNAIAAWNVSPPRDSDPKSPLEEPEVKWLDAAHTTNVRWDGKEGIEIYQEDIDANQIRLNYETGFALMNYLKKLFN